MAAACGSGSVFASDDVLEGDLLDGQLHGLGMHWDKGGTLIGCGKWTDGKLSEPRPVPRSKIKTGRFLSIATQGELCCLLLCLGASKLGTVHADCSFTHHSSLFCFVFVCVEP